MVSLYVYLFFLNLVPFKCTQGKKDLLFFFFNLHWFSLNGKERSAVPSWMKYADGFQLHQHLCRGKLTVIFCRVEMSLWFSWVFLEGAGLSRLITEL